MVGLILFAASIHDNYYITAKHRVGIWLLMLCRLAISKYVNGYCWAHHNLLQTKYRPTHVIRITPIVIVYVCGESSTDSSSKFGHGNSIVDVNIVIALGNERVKSYIAWSHDTYMMTSSCVVKSKLIRSIESLPRRGSGTHRESNQSMLVNHPRVLLWELLLITDVSDNADHTLRHHTMSTWVKLDQHMGSIQVRVHDLPEYWHNVGVMISLMWMTNCLIRVLEIVTIRELMCWYNIVKYDESYTLCISFDMTRCRVIMRRSIM